MVQQREQIGSAERIDPAAGRGQSQGERQVAASLGQRVSCLIAGSVRVLATRVIAVNAEQEYGVPGAEWLQRQECGARVNGQTGQVGSAGHQDPGRTAPR